tara:strand:- start:962 stop:1840 length:879 start_codon:yes stop_codon:yes gene_type:complete
MRRFLKKITLILCLSISFTFLIYFFTFFLNDLKVDLFYENFTTIHKGSIITGTSRARYAIDTKYLTDSLNFKNLSFTRSKSPYNTSYTNFLINYTHQSPNRVTVLSVSPISFEKKFELNEEYFQKFNFEKEDFKKVNLEYLLKEKVTPLKLVTENGKLLLRRIVFGNNHEFDNRNITNLISINKRVDDYPIPNKLNYTYLKNLERLIQHFSKTSKVVLIRNPIRKELYNKETTLIPFFNQTIETIVKKNSVYYFDLNKFEFNPDLKFYDISHVNKNEAKRITKLIDSLIHIQ